MMNKLAAFTIAMAISAPAAAATMSICNDAEDECFTKKIPNSEGRSTLEETETHNYWRMTCHPHEGGPSYWISWESQDHILITESYHGIKRNYHGTALQKDGWFEVVANRSDQDRTLHAVFNPNAPMLIVTGDQPGADHCTDLYGVD